MQSSAAGTQPLLVVQSVTLQYKTRSSLVTATYRVDFSVLKEFDQLLPWKTVRQNVVFALEASGKARCREAGERAMHYIERYYAGAQSEVRGALFRRNRCHNRRRRSSE